MKRAMFFLVFFIGIILFPLISLAGNGLFGGGDGTSENPYLIEDGNDLDEIRNNSSSHFKLVSDVNLSSFSNWDPIMNFSGSLNGNGHTISNLNISRPEMDYVGLFGKTGWNASIKNLGIISGSVEGRNYVGGLAGQFGGGLRGSGSVIEKSYTIIDVKGDTYVGGLVGEVFVDYSHANIKSSYAAGKVSGKHNVGGLIGRIYFYINWWITVSDCYALNSEVKLLDGGNSSTLGRVWGQYYGKYPDIARTFARIDMIVAGSVISNGLSKNKNGEDITAQQATDIIVNGFNSIYIEPVYAGGDGTISDPHLISTPAQLYGVRRYPKLHYKLINDIDLEGHFSNWYPIGDEGTESFSGSLDGNGYTISNLNISRPEMDYVGLFGRTGYDATIKNLGIISGSVEGRNYVGGLVGHFGGGSRAIGSIIDKSYTMIDVKGESYVGGLTGEIYVNRNQSISGALIKNSYAAGKVSGKNYVGGLVGRAYFYVGYWLSISDCYALNSEIELLDGGDLSTLGRVWGRTSDSYQVSARTFAREDMIVTGSVVSNGTVTDKNGLSVSLEDLKKQNTYTVFLEENGGTAWDFVGLWKISEGLSYPYFDKAPLSGAMMYNLSVAIKNSSISQSAAVSEDGNAYSNIQIEAELLRNGALYTGNVIRWEVEIWRTNENGVEIYPNERIIKRINDNNASVLNFSTNLNTDVSKLGGQQSITQRFAFKINVFVGTP